MATRIITEKNRKEIGDFTRTIFHEFEEQNKNRHVGNTSLMSELGNQALLVRDILWLSYGLDIKEFEKSVNLKADNKTANEHLLMLLESIIRNKEEVAFKNVLDEVYYTPETRNGADDPLASFVLDSIKEKEGYSLRKARDIIGKDYNGVSLSGDDVYHAVRNELHRNFEQGKGLLTFKALLGIPNELDIFADFKIHYKHAEQYRKSIVNEGIEKDFAEYNKLWQFFYSELRSGKKCSIKIKNRGVFDKKAHDKIFVELMSNAIKGDRRLDKYFPQECERIRHFARKMHEIQKQNKQKYEGQIKVLEQAYETAGEEKYFSSEKAKQLTDDPRVLFEVFNGIRGCYKNGN
jgi:exoribonuclease R